MDIESFIIDCKKWIFIERNSWNLSFHDLLGILYSLSYLVVASLHDELFKSDGLGDVGVLPQGRGGQQLELSVKLDLKWMLK